MATAFYATVYKALHPVAEPVTKIGGQPVFVEQMDWPVCDSCRRPMDFWWQVRLDEPFRCSDRFTMAYVFVCPTESDRSLNRDCALLWAGYRVQLGAVYLQRQTTAPFIPISSPKLPEYLLTFAEHNEPDADAVMFPDESVEDEAEWIATLQVVSGETKLGGVPMWYHSNQTPICPACGGDMVLVFQFSSILNDTDSLNLDGANFGNGYVFICRKSCTSRSAALVWQHMP